MAKLRVGILFGGKSGEHEVSIVSAMSICKALDQSKYEVTLIGIDKEGRWLLPEEASQLIQAKNPRLIALNQLQDQVSLLPYPGEKNLIHLGKPKAEGISFDVILPILHGTNGEDGTIQGLLELANLPYVGSGVLGSSLAMDKEMAKRVLRDSNIPVVPFITLKKHEYEADEKAVVKKACAAFGFPFFIKPANMGSSVGVHKVKTAMEAEKFIADAFLYDTKVLVEKAIDARELEVAILGNENPKASIIGEIIPTHEFYSYEAKYIDENGADLKIPAENISKEKSDEIRKTAIQAFEALECYGLSRVDFFLDKKTGEIYLNEINTIPGFTSISMYPKLWEATGIPYAKLLDQLIELACNRHKARNALKTTYEPISF